MSKSSHQLPAGLLQPLPIPQRPWSHIATDFITDLPLSRGYTTILTVIYRFSKVCRLIPLPKLPTALETAESLCDHVFIFYGLPEDIVSDWGPEFTSRVWSAICQKLNINVSHTSGYHPQANGLVERLNQELTHFLRSYCHRNQADWSRYLLWSEYAQNSLRKPATLHSNVYWVFNLPYFPGLGSLQTCLLSTPGSNRVRGPGMRLMTISNGQSGKQRSRLIVDGVPIPTTIQVNGSGCQPVINVFGCLAGNSVPGTWVPSKFSGK